MKKVVIIMFALVVSTLNACKEADPPLPDNLVQFESAEQGIDATTTETTIKLKLSRAVDAATPVTLQVTPSGITYGTQFTTTPAVTTNTLSLTVPAGASEASFKLTKAADLFLAGTETVAFSIASASSPVIVGTTKQLTVKFTSIVSSGTTLTLDGGTGGSSAVNAVFVDLSNNAQNSVKRSSWDLGFSTSTDFRVIINNMTGAAAISLSKNDLTQVTAADTVGLVLSTSDFSPSGLKLVDDVSGDLTKTVIPSISATDTDNKVFILNRGTGGSTAPKGWIKLRVLRNGTTGYTLQYAGIKETTFKTVTITKDAAYNFNFVSFDTGAAVAVEPAKAKWDIEWTGGIYITSDGTNNIPYYFSDQVYINYLGGVTAAEVLTSTVTYDAYVESNIATTTFKADRSVIGSNWRVTQGTPIGVKTDRFYVVKDAAGNVYKLKFISFISNDGGVRGNPKFEFKLVKKAS
ncbi:HmuY family protein [Spirosoma foliorum]|uniref:HmuY family protein n=1 Tax=Spirosoma foliorum TaxID=2710596 RepID=A0A7G5H0G4_9BACT|nr:HmuY family protein [Spirosoma foliorum]QMW04606.1 HmuY family protein [Spirosoma foliorum]